MEKLIIDYPKFSKLTAEICQGIAKTGWKPDYIIGISRGGLTPAIALSYWFSVACKPLTVSLRDYPVQESNREMARDAAAGKNILIVDDINDSGATLDWIVEDWHNTFSDVDQEMWSKIWNNNVKFATLVDNLSSDFSKKVDFCGLEIDKSEKDVWVEFPWENWWAQ